MRFLLRLAGGFVLLILVATTGLAVQGDVVLKRDTDAESGTLPAAFSHWFHRIRYKCYACHPTLFQMKAGADKITMSAMQEGQFCGACHDGKTAWAVTIETCNRCHTGE